MKFMILLVIEKQRYHSLPICPKPFRSVQTGRDLVLQTPPNLPNWGRSCDLARLRLAPLGSQPGCSDLSRVVQISAELFRSQPVTPPSAAGEILRLSWGSETAP